MAAILESEKTLGRGCLAAWAFEKSQDTLVSRKSRQLFGPKKLFYICHINNFENYAMELSVNEAKLASL